MGIRLPEQEHRRRLHVLSSANINFSYNVPKGSSLWSNAFTKQALDGWNIDGILTFYYGNPLTIACSAVGAPIGYWTGTPTGGIPFRCQQNGPVFTSTGSTGILNYNLNGASFARPPANSLGIGNTPPTLFYGPGVENVDLSVYKEFRVWGEHRILTVKFEAFNALNHFNPGNPNTSLAINFATGQACQFVVRYDSFDGQHYERHANRRGSASGTTWSDFGAVHFLGSALVKVI